MTLPIPYFRPLAPELPAAVQVEPAADARWNRWMFKAPPLQIVPPKVDLRDLTADWAPKAETRSA